MNGQSEAAYLQRELARRMRVDQLNHANRGVTAVLYTRVLPSPPEGVSNGRWSGMVRRLFNDKAHFDIENLESKA